MIDPEITLSGKYVSKHDITGAQVTVGGLGRAPNGADVVYLYTANGSLMSLRTDFFKENYVPALPNAGEAWELTGIYETPPRVDVICIGYHSGYVPTVDKGVVVYALQGASAGQKNFYLPVTEFLKKYRRVESVSDEQ